MGCWLEGRESKLLNLQVPHPSPVYQGLSNPDKCPSFIADWDCRGAYVDSQYKALQAQVSSLFTYHPVTFSTSRRGV